MGEHGDSEVFVHHDGTVEQMVFRANNVRKVGDVLDVDEPMGQFFKPIAPFGWSDLLRDGICTPMRAPAYALVLMYMHIWAIKEGKEGIKLPLPRHTDLYNAVLSIRKELELEKMLAPSQRRIPDQTHYKFDGIMGMRAVDKR